MAKVTQPLGSSEARGAVGGYVYSTWRGISTVRTRVTPKNEFAGGRPAMQDLLTTVAGHWKDLSDAERKQWFDYAAQHVEVDWTGNDIQLPAWNWWIRIQMRRAINELDASDLPPAIGPMATITTISAGASFSPMNVGFILLPSDIPADFIIEGWITHPLSAGRRATLHDTHREGYRGAQFSPYSIDTPDHGWYTTFLRPISLDGAAGEWRSLRQYNYGTTP